MIFKKKVIYKKNFFTVGKKHHYIFVMIDGGLWRKYGDWGTTIAAFGYNRWKC